jgi:isopropylmalate/homocitrate/citramalate synthase
MLRRARLEFGDDVALGIHLHNTRNAGIVNAYAALNAGVDVIDASTGGAGGCPFVPEATGNIPMEDLVFLLEGMGVPTGVNVQKLIETAQWLEGALGRTLPGMVMKAGNCWASPPRTA